MSRALPVIQVTLTAVLTAWADRYDWLVFGDDHRIPGPFMHLHLIIISLRQIWRGVNGPTCPLCFADSPSHSILGFGAAELMYFTAVALLWYLVGRFLDRWRGLLPSMTFQYIMGGKALALLMITWAMLLLSLSILMMLTSFPVGFRGSPIIRPEIPICFALLFFWSILLITLGIRKLLMLRAAKVLNGG
jgi:hypothetical protein